MGGCEARRAPFGATADGSPVDLYRLRNGAGMEVEVASYGAIVVALRVPDRDGVIEDVVLGYPTLDGYLADDSPYLGAMVGRYANRIARGELVVDGATYALARNDGQNHLHGGPGGFHTKVWSARAFSAPGLAAVELSRTSPDGEEGYPGNLAVRMTFSLGEANELAVECEATTDRPTVCNLAHHGYFDLEAGAAGDVLGHLFTVNALRFTPVDRGFIPTGELRAVQGTPMDFTRPTPLGARIDAPYQQLQLGPGGYDHNYVLEREGPGLALAARVMGPRRGRVLEVLTTEPGLQLYSGNFLDGTITGKGGRVYRWRTGFCLETQHFPDSPHHPEFPSTVLRPGETYRTRTVYRFGVEP
jgi:aldose 1-epimerase